MALLIPHNWTRLDDFNSIEKPDEYIDDSHGSLQLWAALIIGLGTLSFLVYIMLGALYVLKNRKQRAAGIE